MVRLPTATLIAMSAVAVIACGSSGPTSSPTSQLPGGLITQDQAIITALLHVSDGAPGVAPMIYLHDPAAELVIYTRGQNTKPVTGEFLPGERYAWVVQVEGEAQSNPMVLGAESHTHSHAIVYVDAMTNSPFTARWTDEPYFQ
jgi:hypothetical protein